MKFSSKNHPLRKILWNEQGATLIEELMTVAIIAFGIVILVAMITTGVVGVRQVDDKVLAESLARSQLELIKNASYQADPGTTPYPSVASIPGYVVSLGIEYWNAGSGSFTSTPPPPYDGMQKITVTVSTGGDTLVQIATFKVNR
ncbi:MAG: type II secretion system GspH family protein [Anaerolineales bacterium]|nr:type II secretion system GspH family protein [Anaerolineales bacterium]